MSKIPIHNYYSLIKTASRPIVVRLSEMTSTNTTSILAGRIWVNNRHIRSKTSDTKSWSKILIYFNIRFSRITEIWNMTE